MSALATRTVAIIPARYGSTRLPGKPLLEIGGKPMIQHVVERASQAMLVERVLVATDDQRMAGVMTALKTHHALGMIRQPIDDLPFSLIAPLGADDNYIFRFV